MNLQNVVPLIEQMQRDGVVTACAIGGAVAAAFYLESVSTLQTGRPKDKLRVLQFIESKLLDLVLFQAILERHRLIPAWQKFTTQFLTENP
jgi:hypothetical protein